MRAAAIVGTALALALALPSAALAARCAPPGVSGVTQYFESIPGSSCNQTPPTGSGGKGRGSLPASTRHQLGAQGPAGQAVERLVASSGTAPAPAPRPRGAGNHVRSGSTSPAQGTSRPPDTGGGRGLVAGILHPLLTGSTSGGVGVLLPVFLAGVLAGGLALRLVRRRRTGP
jgi:hypothetical protein